MKGNIIVDRTFRFSLSIIDLYKQLIVNNEYVLSKQLLRSATSVGANVEEAIGAFSKSDFVFKLNIALKEARETKYWLRLIDHSRFVEQSLSSLIEEIDQICRILGKIVKTTKANI